MVNTSDNLIDLVYVKNFVFCRSRSCWMKMNNEWETCILVFWTTALASSFVLRHHHVLIPSILLGSLWPSGHRAGVVSPWTRFESHRNADFSNHYRVESQKDYPVAAHHSRQHMDEYKGKDRIGRFMIPWYKSFFSNTRQTRATRHGSCY